MDTTGTTDQAAWSRGLGPVASRTDRFCSCEEGFGVCEAAERNREFCVQTAVEVDYETAGCCPLHM